MNSVCALLEYGDETDLQFDVRVPLPDQLL